ncbi:hypothetical protein GIB67_003417 [Kingdonia uniflora]|uniref:Uncharacterized protein n=1 Tax=Kingdonia uniflora TaxID=39325 RepID=A0A7J7P942_9MAGN|nr:hypothetical protein GIB67_003417 [Kingdonia uniflora]
MVRMTSEKDVTRALFRESRQIKGFFFKLARLISQRTSQRRWGLHSQNPLLWNNQ